jgi:transposase
MMSRARSNQPDTVASLKRMLAAKEALLAQNEALLLERERVIAVRDAELYAKTLQIEHMKAQLAVLRRARFGRSSEKLDREIEQLELVLGELEEGVAESNERAARAQPDAKSGERRKNTDRKPFGRKPLPDHLPRERVVHEPPLACSSCSGTVLRKIGEDVTEVLEYVPSSFKVIEHVRPKLSCRTCSTILQAPLPSFPIERGRAGPALLAHVVVAKFADALPLHRQTGIYQRAGVDLDRSTMADWVGSMAALIDPLYEAIGMHARRGDVHFADDTTVPVLAPGKGRTDTGRLWVVLRDETPWCGSAPPAAFYRYSRDRKAEQAEALLGTCRGFLHADGYAGFKRLYEGDPKSVAPRLIEVACWSHARRKIYDVHVDTGSPLAKEALERIAELFAVEADISGRPAAERLAARQLQSVPRLVDLERFFRAALSQISAKSKLASAIRYALSRWEALTRYTYDGRLEMSNNAAERAIRPLVLGRKNYLFAGSDSGGVRAAKMYTIIETAKLNRLDPEAYLRDIFGRIADHPINRIAELLPWRWKAFADKLAA